MARCSCKGRDLQSIEQSNGGTKWRAPLFAQLFVDLQGYWVCEIAYLHTSRKCMAKCAQILGCVFTMLKAADAHQGRNCVLVCRRACFEQLNIENHAPPTKIAGHFSLKDTLGVGRHNIMGKAGVQLFWGVGQEVQRNALEFHQEGNCARKGERATGAHEMIRRARGGQSLIGFLYIHRRKIGRFQRDGRNLWQINLMLTVSASASSYPRRGELYGFSSGLRAVEGGCLMTDRECWDYQHANNDPSAIHSWAATINPA